MPQKEKLPAEAKIQIVEKYLSGQLGFAKAREEAGVSKGTIVRWVNRYKREGAAGFLPQERNRSYSKETKLAAVMDYLSGKYSLDGICERYKIRSSRQLEVWIKRYNRHEDFRDPVGGNRMTKGRKTSKEERLEIVKACIADGNNYNSTAIKYQVSYNQVYRWTKKYREAGSEGYCVPATTERPKSLRDRIDRLERKILELEMEINLLKKERIEKE